MLCRNIFSEASEVAGEDGEVLLCCNAKKYSELDLATSDDLRYAVRRLNDLHDDPNFDPDEFKTTEKALGFVWSPYNILGDPSMDPYLDVAEQFFHDWMHMIFVGGVFNLTLHYCLEAVRIESASNVYANLKGYISQWKWPKRFKVDKLAELFTDAKRNANAKAKIFKCAASEGLSLYLVISHWALHVLPEDTCPAERQAFIALCDIIDCMRATAYFAVAGDTVLRAVEIFLSLYDEAWGMSWSTPKFHWLLHFGDHVDRFQELVSCWTLERKHKVPKGYGADVRDTRNYERSVLHEVICKHIADLSNPDTFAFSRCGLYKPQAATPDLLEWLACALEVPATAIDCRMSNSARHSAQVITTIGDVILYNVDGELAAGDVWSNFESEGIIACIVQPWKFVSKAHGAIVWEVVNDEILTAVFSEDIVDTVVWSKHIDTPAKLQVKTLLPAHA